MKKNLIFKSLYLMIFLFLSCNGFRFKNKTPTEFLNHSVISKKEYKNNSVVILSQLQGFLRKHKDFFEGKVYFDSTQLSIDTIVYSPDFKKLAVFIMDKYQTDRGVASDGNFEYFYSGTCYIGTRQKDTLTLMWIGSSFTDSNNKIKLSKILRDSYFTDFATKDTVGPFTYKYNMNDVRFWNCPIWKEQEKIIEQRKWFEQEKRKHPENVYEPKY